MRLLLLPLGLLLAGAVHAQPGPDALPGRALWVGVQRAAFRHTGYVADLKPYNFQTPLVGVGFAREGLRAEAAYGRATAPAGRVDVLDVELGVGSAVPLGKKGRLVLDAPLRLAFAYRRVRQREGRSFGDFDVQTLGLLGGARVRRAAGRVAAQAALMGGAAIATRAFDGTPGYTLRAVFEADARTRLSRRFGVVAGYRFQLQRWDLAEGVFGGDQTSKLFDYRGHSHGLFAGLLF